MKILFLQNKGKSYGGIWQVNKMVGEALIRDGYDVTVLSIRENHTGYNPVYDKRMHVETLNPIDEWETYNYQEIINDFKKFYLKVGFHKLISRLHHNKTMNFDKKRLKDFIYKLNPDYIVSSQYQLLPMIPKNYLSKTYHEQHQSFYESMAHIATKKTLLKYQDKVKFIWLSKKTMEEAIKKGFINSISLYNPVRFEEEKKANVINNKKLVTITRIGNEKRIDLMIDMVNSILKKEDYSNWIFEIYGDGECYNLIKDKINKLNHNRIKLMGRTNNPKEVLLSSSINLNTSVYEGFSLSILEANECGIPTVSFDFWESSREEIIDGETGFLAHDENEYISKLEKLMSDDGLLEQMSKNVKEYNKKFHIKNVIKKWEDIFKN